VNKPHVVINVARCQGCNNCFMACKDEHGGNEWPGYSRPQSIQGSRWIEPQCNERGQYPLIDVSYRPTLCSHCADAPCVARAAGAIRKRADGIVLIDPEMARDRPDLVDACPYGMISWNEEYSVPQKCTMCAHLLDGGWEKPRCVQACGPGALSFVWSDDPGFSSRAEAEGLETLHPGSVADTGVSYKNLFRFDLCFIAGSVAVERAGVVDCAAGAVVSLFRADTSDDVPLQRTTTDAFGDFKFDGLEPESGEYLVRVELEYAPSAHLKANLGRSLSLGTILMESDAG
jgi:Fe-S-cluster-containing dehydrogenase component